MKATILFLLLLFPAFSVTYAQFAVRGKVSDADEHTAISGADIMISGTKTGTTSDKDGQFAIYCKSIPCVINVSHLGYKPQKISVKDKNAEFLNVQLVRDTGHLNVFNVFAEKVICINPGDKYFMTDYRLTDGKIIALAYRNRMKNNRYLMVYDALGNKITETEITGDNGMYQDPLLNCYIRMNSKGWQVFHDSAGIFFSEPFDVRMLDSAEKRLVAIKDDTLLLRLYFLSNQGVVFYYLPDENENVSEFRTYVNEDAVGMLYWGPFFDGNEFDRRFAEQIFFKPVKIPVFVRNDEIVVFNTIDGTIERLSGFNGTTVHTADMTFFRETGWTRDILFDYATQKFYTIFITKGIHTISEIEIETGKLIRETIIEGYAHIERISIMNNVLYFLYKKYYGDEYKRLYMSSL
jgi:hypothetical protein